MPTRSEGSFQNFSFCVDHRDVSAVLFAAERRLLIGEMKNVAAIHPVIVAGLNLVVHEQFVKEMADGVGSATATHSDSEATIITRW